MSCGSSLLVAHHLKDLIFQSIQRKRLFLDARLVCGRLISINFFDVNPIHTFEATIRAFIGAFLFLLSGFPTSIMVVVIGKQKGKFSLQVVHGHGSATSVNHPLFFDLHSIFIDFVLYFFHPRGDATQPDSMSHAHVGMPFDPTNHGRHALYRRDLLEFRAINKLMTANYLPCRRIDIVCGRH